MNELVDGVLKSLQTRLANLEAEVADIRADLAAVQRQLQGGDAGGPDIRPPATGIERRVERIERRLNAVDIAIK